MVRAERKEEEGREAGVVCGERKGRGRGGGNREWCVVIK